MARVKKVGKSKSIRKVVRKGRTTPPISLDPVAVPDETPTLTTVPPAPAAIDRLASPTAARRITLADVLDQAAAGTLHAELLSHRGVDAVIDAGAVRRIGGQCLQVLLSASATWTHDGAALAVVNSSPEFIAGVRLLGIDPGELVSQKPLAGVA